MVEATRMESSGDSTERLRELMIKLLIDTEKRIEPTASTVIASGKPTAAIGVDPAQRFIVAADESGSFHVYSFDLKNQLGQLTLDSPETTNVTNIEVIEETKTVLAIVDNRIWMWDVSELLDSNSQRKKIPGHAVAENVTAISLDRPQKRFAVAIRNVGVMVGNVSDFGKLPFSFDGPAVLKIDTGDVTVNCMDFSSGSDRLFLGMGNTILQCRSVDDGRMIGFHKNLREPIRTLVSAVHGVVWSDSTSYSVCKWQVDSPNLRSNRFSGAVVSVINVGESSVAVCEDGAIHLMSRAGQILATSVEVKAAGELRCISTSNVGRTFFTGNADGSIQEWNIIGSKTASDWRSHHPLAITTSNTLVSGFSSKEFSSQAPSLTDFAIPISTASCFDSKSGNLYLAQRERLAWFNSASDETRYIDSDLSSEIVQVAVDPVQNLVATMHANGRLQVRNQTTGKLVTENSLPERSVRQIGIADGFLITSGKSGVSVWRMDQDFSKVKQLSTRSSKFYMDGELLVLYGQDSSAQVIHVGDWKTLVELKGHSREILSVQIFSGDNSKTIVTLSSDKSIRFWDPESSSETRKLPVDQSATRIAVDPLGKFGIISSQIPTVDPVLIDLENGNQIAIFEKSGCPLQVFFSSDGKRFWFAGSGAAQFERRSIEQAYKERISSPDGIESQIKNDFNYVICGPPILHHWAVDVSPNLQWLVSVGHDATVRILDWETKRLSRFLGEHDDVVWSCAFSSDSRWLATGGIREDRGEIFVWDTETWQIVQRFYLGRDLISGLQFDPTLPLLAASSFDGTAYLLNHKSGKIVKQLLNTGPRAMDVEFSPDGKFLAVAKTARGASVWEIVSGESAADDNSTNPENQVLNVEVGPEISVNDDERIWTVEFSGDGSNLITASQAGVIRFYSFPDLQPVVSIETCTDGFRQLGLSRDDQYLAASAWSSNPGVIINLKKLRESLGQFGLDW